MYVRQLRDQKGYSLQFCDMEEANALLEFIETYPDAESNGDMKRLARKLRSNLSDAYADDVTKYSMPLWFEDVPSLITALWIAYTSWDSSEFGQRAQKAVFHDDKLWDERMTKVKKRNEEESKKVMGIIQDMISSASQSNDDSDDSDKDSSSSSDDDSDNKNGDTFNNVNHD